MKRSLLIFMAVFGMVLSGFSQTEKLTGKVLNKKNDPVVGATIKIDGSNAGTTSDIDGNFSLSLSTGKKYTLTISSVNYQAKTISDVEVTSGQVNELQIVLDAGCEDIVFKICCVTSKLCRLVPYNIII